MSNAPIEVLEKATPQNFFREGYLLANRDIDQHVREGGNAEQHLRRHGVAEGRLQVTRAFFEARKGAYGRAKFERFAAALDVEAATPQFLGAPDSFPVAMTGRHLTVADYSSGESSNNFGPFAAEIEANPDKLYMDLGSGLRSAVYPNCLYVEVYPSLSVDVVVGTDCVYPIRSGSLDGIGCFAVLEHTQKPWVVAQEIRRMLKPGGICLIDWPFLQPVHGYPSHYYNATREGLRLMFEEGFEISTCGTLAYQGPDYTVNWVLGKMIRDMPEALRQRFLGMTVAELLDHAPQSAFWREAIAGLPDAMVSEFACGNTLIARKLP